MVDANSRHGRHLCQIQGGVWPTADVQNYEESVRFKEMYGLQQICRILERVSDPMGCVAYHR